MTDVLDEGLTYVSASLVQAPESGLSSSLNPAFDVVLSDTLPPGLENITALLVAGVTGGASTPLLTNNGSHWNSSPFNMPAASTITISFTAQLGPGVIPSQQIQNQATAAFSSRDGLDPHERDGSGGLNDYNVSGNSQTLTVMTALWSAVARVLTWSCSKQ